MITYPWPSSWIPDSFELRLIPNQRAFVGPYVPTVQVIDLLGERWQLRFDLPPSPDEELTAAREAFFDRLKGASHAFSIHHYMSPFPRGTMRYDTTLAAPSAFLSNVLALNSFTGLTLIPGDMVKVDNQLFRVMEKATAVSNVLTVEVEGRVRVTLASGAPVTLVRPTAKFLMKGAEGVGITWRNDRSDAITVEGIEVWT